MAKTTISEEMQISKNSDSTYMVNKDSKKNQLKGNTTNYKILKMAGWFFAHYKHTLKAC